MNVATKASLLVLTLGCLAAGLCACDRRGGTPGEKLDRALAKTGDKVKEVGESIKPR